MDISAVKVNICVALGVAGSVIASLFGGWSMDFGTLCIFIAVDYISGMIAAGVFHTSPKSASGTLNSNVGFKGICKKAVILLLVLIAHRLDLTMNCNYIRTAVIIAFIVNELISIVENVELMGMHVPKPILKAINVLKNREDDE